MTNFGKPKNKVGTHSVKGKNKYHYPATMFQKCLISGFNSDIKPKKYV